MADYIFKYDGEWFYWDAAHVEAHGPFPSRGRAAEDHEKRLWRDSRD